MKIFTRKPDESTLIEACKLGKPAAQKAIYDKYSRKMLGLCCRYIADVMQAEDVMITGFVKVFEKVETFKSEGSFEGWIRKIMVNEALGYLRKYKNIYLTVSTDDLYHEPTVVPESTALEAEDLLKLVQQLPEGYRTVFNLYAIEGYNHKEIGEMLGISENTSKSQLSRARNLLQRYLAEIEKKNLKQKASVSRQEVALDFDLAALHLTLAKS
ncbi:MAG: sigma-70 family RNA polymerase sigma factor [Verrucomicrobia bacterium]|nr:sigma-70 family RNA polymerase sigma factor [Cytophagales bacterium]